MADAVLGKRGEKDFKYPLSTLKKHFVALGGSGSGKTVLCKVLIEEASQKGIPCILVDPQGDLASLAIPNKKKLKVVIFTPTSSKGIPICINPLRLPEQKLDKEELVSILNQISSAIVQLLGYKIESDKGRGAQSLFYTILEESYKSKIPIEDFGNLADMFGSPTEDLVKQAEELLGSKNELKALHRKVKYLTIGEKELLFNFGVPLDIDLLLKAGISVIYLNTLGSLKDKDFFVSMLGTKLYEWMISNPSGKVQALFYIDEISSYLPAGNKLTLSKPILNLIYKQARKYGVGCVVSTQNPGDIDYKAFAQFGTWAIGRLTTKQDRDKVKDALKSLAAKNLDKVVGQLPKLKPGNFVFFCPDLFKNIEHLKVRWLLTKHKTLNEAQVKAATIQQLRDFYEKFEVEKKPKELKESSGKITVEKGKEHFDLKINHDKILEIVQKKKKKMFGFFGPDKEQLDKVNLELRPLYLSTVRVQESKFLGLGKKIKEYTVFFDGITGNVFTFKGQKYRLYKWEELFGLSDAQIKLLKVLRDRKLTVGELALKMKLTGSAVSSTLKQLQKDKIVSYEKAKSNVNEWFSLAKIDVSQKIDKIDSGEFNLSDKKVDGKEVKPKMNIKEISKIVRGWFGNADIVKAKIVYYPVYEIKYVGKKGSRKVYVSGVDGNVL